MNSLHCNENGPRGTIVGRIGQALCLLIRGNRATTTLHDVSHSDDDCDRRTTTRSDAKKRKHEFSLGKGTTDSSTAEGYHDFPNSNAQKQVFRGLPVHYGNCLIRRKNARINNKQTRGEVSALRLCQGYADGSTHASQVHLAISRSHCQLIFNPIKKSCKIIPQGGVPLIPALTRNSRSHA